MREKVHVGVRTVFRRYRYIRGKRARYLIACILYPADTFANKAADSHRRLVRFLITLLN